MKMGDLYGGNTGYLDFMTIPSSQIPTAPANASTATSGASSFGSGIDWGGLLTGAVDIYKTKTAADLQKEQLKAQQKIAEQMQSAPQRLPAGYQYQANGQLVYTGTGQPAQSGGINNMLLWGIIGVGSLAALYFATR